MTEKPATQPTQPKGTDKDGKPYALVQIPVPKVGTIRAAISQARAAGQVAG
jgi:hypothetical protein